MGYCTNCGNLISGNDRFCTKCGTEVSAIPMEISSGSMPSNKKAIKILPIIAICCVVLCMGALTIVIIRSHIGNKNELLGQWELINKADTYAPFYELELFSDNTYASDDSNYNGSYSVDDDRIMFEGILVSPINFTYTVEKDILKMSDERGDALEFHRIPGTSIPSGSNEKAKRKLRGQWELIEDHDINDPFEWLEFFSDGQYSSDDSNYNGKYSVDGDRIKFEGILESPVVYSFEIDDDILILSNDSDDLMQFKKVQ